MHFEIRRDFCAVRFVRASSLVEGFGIYAGGAGFSIPSAIARCRSEHIERGFQLAALKPQGIKPEGIAAHPDATRASEHAYYEAVESFLAEGLARTKQFEGVPLLHAPRFKWWVQRLDCGWASTIVADIGGACFVSSAAKSSLPSALLKNWEEYRNPLFHGLNSEDLENYTKPLMQLGLQGGRNLSFKTSLRTIKAPARDSFNQHQVLIDGHAIVYLTSKRRKT